MEETWDDDKEAAGFKEVDKGRRAGSFRMRWAEGMAESSLEAWE